MSSISFYMASPLRGGILALQICLLLFCAGCSQKAPQIDPVTYRKEVTDWQIKRAKSISSETGWLTLAGLCWLKPGENTFGSDSADRIVLPAGIIPKIAGSIFWKDTIITAVARSGADVRYRDTLIKSMRLRTDEDGSPTVLSIGSVSFYVIKRGSQLGVRIRDRQNPARLHFTGLDFFPIDPQWRIEGKYEAYPSPRIMPVNSVIGTVTNDTFPGFVTFSRNGTDYRLIAGTEQGDPPTLYFMFSDETGGKETYGLGRQLSVPMPDSAGNVIMDFNKAYNWPCAYTDFATCPIPPRENHLALRVEAGEKKYPGHEEH